MNKSEINLPILWREEFLKQGIPSSFRAKPSSAVVRFANFLSPEKFPGLIGADLGCGTGRNSIYLSELGCDITAVDFVPEMIATLNDNSKTLGIYSKLRGQTFNLTKSWNFHNSFDFFIDTYCFKHITRLAARHNYKSELLKYSRKGTYYLLTLASTEDGYYKQHEVRMEQDLVVILDPGNHIESILHTKNQVLDFFCPEFELVDFQENIQANIMHGKGYTRNGFEFTFCRI